MKKLINIEKKALDGQEKIIGTFIMFNEDETQIIGEPIFEDFTNILKEKIDIYKADMAETQNKYIEIKAKEQLAAKKAAETVAKTDAAKEYEASKNLTPFEDKNKVVAAEEPKKDITVNNVSKTITKKRKLKVWPKVLGLIIVGGLILGGVKSCTDKKNTTPDTGKPKDDDKIVEVTPVTPAALVAHDITEAEFIKASEDIAKYLTSKGLSTDATSIYSTVFMVNIDSIDQEVIDTLEEKNYIQDNMSKIMSDSLGALADINTFNSTIANNAPDQLDSKMISYVPFILASEKDKQNLLHEEAEYLKMVHANATTYQPLYMNTFYFMVGTGTTNYPFTKGEMSVGGLYLAKQGPASQINEDAKKFMSDEVTKAFEAPITDLNNEMRILQECGFSSSIRK